MQKNLLQRAKGVRDFGTSQQIQRQGIIEILKSNFELFGFNPIETPILERYELFASKFGQGDQSEAMAETFKLTDQGKRALVLRNEFTIPFARFVGMNPNLKMPFKRYQLGQIFRDGPIKLGRYREFWQCDVDIVGVKKITAEVELINLALAIFEKLGLEVEVQINNRKFLNDVLEKFNIASKNKEQVIIILDKIEKIGEKGVLAELKEKKIDIKNAKKLFELLKVKGDNQEKIDKFKKELEQSLGLQEIEELLSLIKNKNVLFTPSLARGLSYYTGTVLEIFLKDKSTLSSALAGGGRYDDMIGGFLGRKEQIPAVGISFGLETILDAFSTLNKLEEKQTMTQLYIVPVGVEIDKILPIVSKIRSLGIKTDFDFQARNFKKNLSYADSLGIKFVGIIGEDEIKAEKIMIKDMTTGKQELVAIEELLKKIKK